MDAIGLRGLIWSKLQQEGLDIRPAQYLGDVPLRGLIVTNPNGLELLILVSEFLPAQEEPAAPAPGKREIIEGSRHHRSGWTLQLEKVRCGKKGCKKCPHGPYWYGYRKSEGRTQTRYVGKSLDRFFGEGVQQEGEQNQ